MKQTRLISYDIMRIISFIAIIVIHVSARIISTTSLDISSWEWICLNIFNTASRFGVPLFIMISGVFMLSPDKIRPLKKLYRVNILRLLVAWVFWTVVYVFLENVMIKGFSYFTSSSIGAILTDLANGYFHLWFIPMLIGLYMIIPFLQQIAKDKKLCEYFLILAFIFASVIPFLVAVLPFGEVLETLAGKFHLNFVLQFPIYFLGGYYFHTYPPKKNIRRLIYVLAVVGAVFSVVITQAACIRLEKFTDTFMGPLMPLILAMSLGMFLFIKTRAEQHTFSLKSTKAITLISSLSFGIYLTHILFDTFFYKFIIPYIPVSGVILVPIGVIFVSIFSFTASFILNKIPIINKYIV